MKYHFKTLFNVKQYAKLVLALFVLSVINMAIQVPVHAAMKQEMVVSHQMTNMPADNMHECDCPPTLCASISALDDQRLETLQSVSVDYLINFYVVYVSHIEDAHHQYSATQFAYHEWQYRKIIPHPSSFNTILHI